MDTAWIPSTIIQVKAESRPHYSTPHFYVLWVDWCIRGIISHRTVNSSTFMLSPHSSIATLHHLFTPLSSSTCTPTSRAEKETKQGETKAKHNTATQHTSLDVKGYYYLFSFLKWYVIWIVTIHILMSTCVKEVHEYSNWCFKHLNGISHCDLLRLGFSVVDDFKTG